MLHYYALSDRPAVGSMTATALLTDNSVGDQTTGVTAENTVTLLCANNHAIGGSTSIVTTLIDLLAVNQLTAIDVTVRAVYTEGCGANPDNTCYACPRGIGDPPVSNSNTQTAVLEYSTNGTVWTTLATRTLTNATFARWQPSFSPVTARYVRAVVQSASLRSYVEMILGTQVDVTDYRAIYTMLLSTPPNLRIVGTCGSPVVAWDAVTHPDVGTMRYRLRRVDDSSNTIVYDGTGTQATLSATGWTVGTSRSYTIESYSGGVSSPASSPLAVIRGNVPATATLSSDFNPSGAAVLSWSPPNPVYPAVTGYVLKRDGTTIYTGTATTFTDEGRDPLSAVTYTLITTNNCGDSTTTLNDGPASPPEPPTLTIETSCGASLDTLTWTASTSELTVTYQLWADAVGVPGSLLYEGAGREYLSARTGLIGRIYCLVAVSLAGSVVVYQSADDCPVALKPQKCKWRKPTEVATTWKQS